MMVFWFMLIAVLFLQVNSITNLTLSGMVNSLLHTTVPLDIRKFPSISAPLLLYKQLKDSFPFVAIIGFYFILMAGLKLCRKQEYLKILAIKNKALIEALSIVSIAALLFYVMMYKWSYYHPFIFFWVMPVLAIIYAYMIQGIQSVLVRNKSARQSLVFHAVFIAIISISLVKPIKKFMAFQWQSSYPSKIIHGFQDITANQKSVVQFEINGDCQEFNWGTQAFLASRPNRWYHNHVPEGYQHILIQCDPKKTVITNLANQKAKKIFYR